MRSTDWLDTPALFVTFTTYGSWLHGDPRGSVNASNNHPGSRPKPGDLDALRSAQARLKQPPMEFGPKEREAVREAIEEVCRFRGWHLNALNVRTRHVHAVPSAETDGDRVIADFKAYATRRLVRQGLVPAGRRIWTEGGSARAVRRLSELERVCRYVIEEQ